LKLTLDDQRRLFVHLGMTGWFERSAPGAPALRFDRVRFELERRGTRSRVVYVDPRRWGRMILSDEDIGVWRTLGPDPLDDGIVLERLEEKLRRRKKRSIKEVLMDQTVLAGVGNIQAIEALWKAGIHPRSKAHAISKADLRAIARGLRWTIDRTLLDLAKGGMGDANPFRIYGRKGAPCPRCGHRLESFVLGGRTTTACPACQELRTSARAARRS
jgi:formamidopyrimidine-DNA glycosylase